MADPIVPTVFPTALFALDPDVSTVQEVIDQLKPLGSSGRSKTIRPTTASARSRPFFDPATKEIWAVATVENWGSPRHRHNPGGIYGELVITLAGCLEDVTDGGETVQCVPGTALWHAGNTVHQAVGQFWAGIYHQPRGSTPAPLTE